MSDQFDELLKQSANRLKQHRLILEIDVRPHELVVKRYKKRIVVSCIILLICSVTFMTPLSSKVFAYVFNLLRTEMFEQVVDKGLVTHVAKESLHQGIKLNVENLYVDQSTLTFDMVQSFTKEAESRTMLNTNDIQLFIDGKRLSFHSGGDFHDLKDGRYGGIIYYHSNYGYEEGSAVPLPEQFLLTIKVDRIGDIQGNWSIELPVSRQITDQVTQDFKPGISHEVDGISIKVARVLMTPLSTTIDFEFIAPVNYSFTDPFAIRIIQVEDDKGFMMGRGMVFVGNEDEEVEDNRRKYRFSIEYLRTPKDIPKELVIIPQREVIYKKDESVTYARGEALEPYVFKVPLQK
ncbi:DUF5643 domain-containing protein [Paenibacillus sp. OAS669]|uniref:DUF5643 domain-containing protein n=1 Tax=Paenibacillus sp. OAS669 TaxID=2663821 RepID=UPI00178A4C33|nr:DUF5643 domain-containing protein [Paenibacillus sp. OAS669]MBE1442832.1 hypothetical protein [Paenibacillus sp. OAS669]